MTALPAAEYFSDVSRTNGQAKQAQDDILARAKEMPGGAAATELTLASGSVTPTGAVHRIDTESDASSDDLDTIATTNIEDGGLLLILAAHDDRTVVVKHGTGNIATRDGLDISLTDAAAAVLFWRDGSTWRECFRTLSIGVDVQAYDADTLFADTSDNLTAGFTCDVYDYGNSGTSTQTVSLTGEPLQTLGITGSFTLAPPSSGNGVAVLLATTDGTGGYTLTTSGFTVVNGTYDNAADKVHRFVVTKIGAVSILDIDVVV